MTHNSIQAPEQTSRFNINLVAVLGTAIGALAGLLAFAPFFAPITG